MACLWFPYASLRRSAGMCAPRAESNQGAGGYGAPGGPWCRAGVPAHLLGEVSGQLLECPLHSHYSRATSLRAPGGPGHRGGTPTHLLSYWVVVRLFFTGFFLCCAVWCCVALCHAVLSWAPATPKVTRAKKSILAVTLSVFQHVFRSLLFSALLYCGVPL